MSNLELIKKIPLIVSAEKVILTKKMEEWLKKNAGKDIAKLARKNANKIDVYKIIYTSQGHKVVGFIAEPKRTTKKLPCVITNRGGSGEFGAWKIGALFLNYVKLTDLAARGYIVITTQYSGNGGSEGKDEYGGSEIKDVLTLYKILKKYRHADTNRVGMYGESRGGTMTYLSLARVKWIKAAAVVSAASDFVDIDSFRPKLREHQKKMYGGSMEEDKKRSALYWPEKFNKKTPILILAGTADWRVNPLDSIRLSEKLYEHKVPHRLVMFEGGDHRLSEYVRDEEELIYRWFDRFVKNKGKLPNLKPHDL